LFWALTPAEIGLILDAQVARIEREGAARRAELHTLASLIAIATHNPKQMPSYGEFVGGQKRRAGSSDAAISAYFLTIKAHRGGDGKGSDRGAAS
jgi:hypothetical protein